LIGSIFPENIEFDGKKIRTTRINDVLRYILLIDNDLYKNKKGQISKFLSLSRLVVGELSHKYRIILRGFDSFVGLQSLSNNHKILSLFCLETEAS